ncbi:aminodeoxychorismate lyase [Alkalihalobacillus sp. 1P02AB]|uniref:aminodeoxychorismate lyase n=1 Tax=Alkalihalobacillus sp. 1P02AB TaxID=3132260 RepID=UPI0039A73FB2
MYIYLNDQIIDSKEAKISVFDHGYLYGVGLFETFAIYDGHPFLLDDHFLRLQEGLKHIGIDWFMEKEEAVSILQQLLKANRLKDAYVRWNVSAGPQEVGLFTGVYKEPTLTVLVKPLPAKRATPKKVEILSLRRNTPEGRFRLKSHHYLNNLLAKREMAHNSPDVEGVFLTEEGYVAEGLVSNLFWVKDGQVYTPTVETGILNGVTRQFVITLLRKANIKVKEGFYQLHELEAADEIFMTNSIQELVPLNLEFNKIDDSLVFELLEREYQLSKQKKLWSRYEL